MTKHAPATTTGLDPRVALATGVHTSPGLYALLLGSGVSSSAGVPTGWQVVVDLVRRAAAAAKPDDPEAGAIAAANPARWWADYSTAPFGYSTLLGELAPTAAARQALLARYFEPTDTDREAGRKVPTAAHRAVARFVARGAVRVILTTNFDRLTERALEDEGISPQVLHRAEQIPAATPLAHARATVIKLHGDYADLDQRNTLDELRSYPPEIADLLTRVLDDYGLIVCGWSAEWDAALVAEVEATRSRRYPLFWSTYGGPSEAARRVIAQHHAVVIAGDNADELFTGLLARLDALDRLNAPPLTRELAVAQLKRALPDPARRIEAFDVVDGETTRTVTTVSDRERYPLSHADTETQFEQYRADCDTLLHLLAAGVFHDDGTHDALWTRTLQRLLNVRGTFTGGYNDVLEAMRHVPALLAFWVAGTAAICSKRESTLAVLLRTPTWASQFGEQRPQPVGATINPNLILERAALHAWTRWGGMRWHYPASHLLRETCREPLHAVEPDDIAYRAACDRLEFLVSLTQMTTEDEWLRYPWAGEFYGERLFSRQNFPLADQVVSELSPTWPLVAGGLFADEKQAQDAVEQLTSWIAEHRRFG